jgi:hypothetical protein
MPVSYDTVAVRYPGIGSKLVCVSCSARFYDLMKVPAVCPKCGTVQPAVAVRVAPVRRGGPLMRRPMPAAPVAAEAEDDAVPLVEADDEDEDAVEEEIEEIDEDPVLEEVPD